MPDLKQLKSDARGLGVLYIEDNKALRENASKLLMKFFDPLYSAEDGVEGLEIFKKKRPQIVITDIKMPKMDGLELTQKIKKISPETKVIIMSAFDDKENLHKGVKLGVSDFLSKPVNITELTEVLHTTVQKILQEKNKQIFYSHLQSIFNYQSSMVMMVKERKPIIVNQMMLDFFGVESIEEGLAEYGDLGNRFLEHDGFLYNKLDRDWFEEVSTHANKLYHVKVKNAKGEIRHLILKYQLLPEKKGYAIVSLDDVTELNLLKLFDSKQVRSDENIRDTKSMFNLLEVIQRNSAKVVLHNYYKGLSITNDAVIVQIKDGSIVLKSSFLQLKAVQVERRTLIVSEALPNPIACEEVVQIGFEKQSIEFKKIHFISNSPVQRSTIRLVPDKHSVSLFLGEKKFQGELSIEDISLDAVKLNLSVLPAGLMKDDEVVVDMVLTMDNKPLIINTKAVMLRKSEGRFSFSVVFMFKFKEGARGELVKYITKRQMAIIREFKGLQNG
ncbi:MAG: hypothetical protein AUK54_05750 [Helicobacteraceae bacterium CG2_30_36_10]|nr:MAG: hypothetical protein AUK54_05750 [Helicobacteraceae bacterium CG2_30_36_10]